MTPARPPPRVVSLDAEAHHPALGLLPWYVTGALDAEDRAEVEAHLAGCARCRGELALERRLQAATAALPTTAEAQRGFDALRRRIRTPPSPASRFATAARGLRAAWRATAPWARATLALQFALLVGVIAIAPWGAGVADGAYRALGEAPAARATLLVRFHEQASERDIRAVLRASGARLVDGPTASDAYLLAVPAASAGEALRRLRAAPAVALAESLEGGAR